ncbi:hypothetical protein BH11PSE11_BH11PSE11_36640 [soil metagenome]
MVTGTGMGMAARNRAALVKPVGWLFFVATIPCCSLVHAQAWTIVPEINLVETFSNNIAQESGSRSQGWITDLSPALHITGSGSRVKATLDYRLDSLHYAGHPELQRNSNSLNSFATVDVFDKWLFLDASANITQRKQSAFGTTAIDATSSATNQSETRTAQLSPYIRGQFSDIAAYQMRLNAIESRTNDESIAKTTFRQWSGTFKNASAGAKIGWYVNGLDTEVKNAAIGSLNDTRLFGGINVEVLPALHLLISNGKERTNFATPNKQTLSTPGVGFDWSPSPRTKAAGVFEKRFFGTAGNVLLNHRTALTNWRYTDIKDVANLPLLLAGPGQGTIADLMSDLLAASLPDPAARATAVRERLNQNGVLSGVPAGVGVQTSRLFISRTREASVAVIGARNTLTLSFLQLDQEALGNGTGIIDSFTLSNNIREQSTRLGLVHRFTPLTTINFAAARQRVEGLASANLNSSQTSFTCTVTHNIGPKSFFSLGARSIKFDSTVNGNSNENAVIAAFTQRF